MVIEPSEMKQKCLYQLGFHYLRASQQPKEFLELSLECFLKAYALSPSDEIYFYIALIHDYKMHQEQPNSSFLYDFFRDYPENRKYTELQQYIRKGNFLDYHDSLLTLSLCYQYGLFGLTASKEQEKILLKQVSQQNKLIDEYILKIKFPLLKTLSRENQIELEKELRLETSPLPSVAIIGGGLSGTITALLLDNLIKQGKISFGKIYLLEKNQSLLSGASLLPCRLHLGGEYPKDKITAYQCLFGSVLFRQMFQTDLVLTKVPNNTFLLAKESTRELKNKQSFLTKDDFLEHHQDLRKRYEHYLSQFPNPNEMAELLFGSSLTEKLTEQELENLGLEEHFCAGVRTKERGLQSTGLGTVLEHALKQSHNIQVLCGYEVDHIEKMTQSGYIVSSGTHPRIAVDYLIHAAFEKNLYLQSLLLKSFQRDSEGESAPSINVFSRALAVLDIQPCVEFLEKTPKAVPDSSFFGILGKEGGMVSFFNRTTATVFVPNEGLSYQGEYVISPTREDPSTQLQEMEDCTRQFEQNKVEIGQRILQDIIKKFPFLEGAKLLDLIFRPTVSANGEIYKRTHIDVSWLGDQKDCLQVFATKATFAPFVALQTVARLILQTAVTKNFNPQEKEFLEQFLSPEGVMLTPESFGNGVLPQVFNIVPHSSFLSKRQFLRDQYWYAFQRNLPFSLFDPSNSRSHIGINSAQQLRFLLKLKNKKQFLELQNFFLDENGVKVLNDFFVKRPCQKLKGIYLGQPTELLNEGNNHHITELLNHMNVCPSLKELSFTGWNLTLPFYYESIATIMPKLQKIAFHKWTIFNSSSLKRLLQQPLALTDFCLTQGNLDSKTLETLLSLLCDCKSLQNVDLADNQIGSRIKDKSFLLLEKMVENLSVLRILNISKNELFNFNQKLTSLENAATLPLMVAITHHQNLKRVHILQNGPISEILQNRLEYFFLISKKNLSQHF